MHKPETLCIIYDKSDFYCLQIGMSREKEVAHLKHFNKHNIAVPLVATFTNGMVTKLVPGKMPEPKDMGDPHISR